MKADRFDGSQDGWPELVRLATGRMEEYAQLWEGAAAKFSDSSYRSEDLIDDWFTCWGKWVRDSTALATVGWKAWVAEGVAGRPKDGTNDA